MTPARMRWLPLTLLALAACARSDVIPPRVEGAAGSAAEPPPTSDSSTSGSSGSTGDDGVVQSCQSDADCTQGFQCEGARCILNGADGPIQATLTWHNRPRTPEDLDLHLVEPSGCEIFWGNHQCVGSLDLDANAGCTDTAPDGGVGADTENIIYPAGSVPPAGTYMVRVDYWADCDEAQRVPFTLTVRYPGHQPVVVDNAFVATDADEGAAGSGRTEVVFNLP